MATNSDKHERAAGGLDFDEPIRERAASLGATMAENGPEALFDEIENLLPEAWRDHIKTFPLAAMAAGIGIGVYLGLKRSNELIAAGSSMLSAAALANVQTVMDRAGVKK
jgi:hypothetical protein